PGVWGQRRAADEAVLCKRVPKTSLSRGVAAAALNDRRGVRCLKYARGEIARHRGARARRHAVRFSRQIYERKPFSWNEHDPGAARALVVRPRWPKTVRDRPSRRRAALTRIDAGCCSVPRPAGEMPLNARELVQARLPGGYNGGMRRYRVTLAQT